MIGMPPFESSSDQAGPSELGIRKGMISNGNSWDVPSDGMVYGLANTRKSSTPQEGGMHMGGNVLMGFQQENVEDPREIAKPKWAVVLPKKSVGLAAISGGRGAAF